MSDSPSVHMSESKRVIYEEQEMDDLVPGTVVRDRTGDFFEKGVPQPSSSGKHPHYFLGFGESDWYFAYELLSDGPVTVFCSPGVES